MARFLQEIITGSEEETAVFAASFAANIKAGDVILLRGDLGAGKSVFARSVIRNLCGVPDLEVPSPTYTLVQQYDIAGGVLWHFDLYRLSDPSEVYETGWEEALNGGVIMVEWPERLGSLLPRQYQDVRIEGVTGHPNQRKISITRHGA